MYSVILTDVCVHAWQHSPWRVLTPRPVLPSSLSVSTSYLHLYTDLMPSSLLFYPPILSCSSVSFVSAAVTSIQGGGAGQAARSSWQDMALGMGRLDRPGNSTKEFSAHLLLFCCFVFSPLPLPPRKNCPHIAWSIARLPVFINLLCLFQERFARSFVFSLTHETTDHEFWFTDLVS